MLRRAASASRRSIAVEDRRVLRDVLLEQARALAEHDPGEVAREALVEIGERRRRAAGCRPPRGSTGGRGRCRGSSRRASSRGGVAPPPLRPGAMSARTSSGTAPAPRAAGAARRRGSASPRAPRRALRARRAPRRPRAPRARSGPRTTRPAVRLELDDPGGLELAQRLAHGRPADAELGRQRLLPQARARGISPREHARLDRRREPVDERRRPSLRSSPSRGDDSTSGSN